MNRTIKKVAVLGSGVMGSRIACHFANIGVQVLLLDIVPFELNEEEQKKGLTKESPAVRNRIVTTALQNTLKANPSSIYEKTFASRITTGNFDDDLPKIKDYDWIIEVVDGLAANGEDGNAEVEAKVRGEVAALCARYPLYPNL